MSSFNGISSGTIILSVGVLLLYLICMWRIFEKAGISGWKCLVPIYSGYLLWKIAWEGSKFWVVFFGTLVVYLLSFIQGEPGSLGGKIYMVVSIAWAVYSLILTVYMCMHMAQRFDKSAEFGVVGLFLLSIIGYLILGFGKANYNADRDTDDGESLRRIIFMTSIILVLLIGFNIFFTPPTNGNNTQLIGIVIVTCGCILPIIIKKLVSLCKG